MPVDPNRATTFTAAAAATAVSTGTTSVTADTATTMVAPSRSLTSSQTSSPRPISALPHPHQHRKALHFPSPSLYTAQALSVRSPNPRPSSQLSIPHVPKGIDPFSTDQMVTVSTHGSSGVRARGSPHLDYLNHPLMTSLHNSQHPHLGSAANVLPVSSHAKIGPRTKISHGNGCKDRRDRSRDDNLIFIKSRNVRITEDASLYALCRSWLRNITYEDLQVELQVIKDFSPVCLDTMDSDLRSENLLGEGRGDYSGEVDGSLVFPKVRQKDVTKELPKPLTASVMSRYMSNKKVEEEQEDEKSVENLTPRDILQRHIQRSKKVRGRLREERLQRISRYRSRLSLLLPSPAEQFKNDTAAGN